MTVVMPCFDAAAFVAEAVQSILSQSFADLELIVADDGSTDGTLGIARAVASTDPRVNVFSPQHGGVVVARNHALAIARGEFVALMDADDVALPDRLVTQVAFLDRCPEVAAVGSWMQVVDADRRPQQVLKKRPTDVGRRHASTVPIFHPTAMIRRSAIDAVGGIDRVSKVPRTQTTGSGCRTVASDSRISRKCSSSIGGTEGTSRSIGTSGRPWP